VAAMWVRTELRWPSRLALLRKGIPPRALMPRRPTEVSPVRQGEVTIDEGR
jgi:hypothetical protein